jgi:hypothetical protein
MPTKARRTKKKRRAVSATGWSERADQRQSRPHCIQIPSGIPEFEIKEAGAFNIDIIPFELGTDSQFGEEGDLYFEKTYFTHQGIGIRMGSYACLSQMNNEPCPVCEYGSQMPRDTKAEKDLANKMFPKHRQLWIVWDHNDRKAGPKIWDVSYHLFGKALKAKLEIAEEDDDWDIFHDPEDGMTLRCLAEEKTFMGRTFYTVDTLDFKPRKHAIPERFLDHGIDLDSCIQMTGYDELKDLLSAAPPSLDDKKSKKKQEDDVDEGTEAADEWDEDEEDEKPKQRRRRKPSERPKKRSRRKPVEDVDLDDTPFDDEEEWDKEPKKSTTEKRRRRSR